MDLDLLLLATKDRTLALMLLALFVFNLLFTGRSRIDAWAEANPRVAAVMKALRSVGLDPWLMLASATLAIKGKLPASSKQPVPKPEPVHVVFPDKSASPPEE